MKKRFLQFSLLLCAFSIAFFLAYFNNTKLVNPKTAAFYYALKDSLKQKGFSAKLLVISTKRFEFHNKIQVWFSGAASKSKHLTGDAIDFLVFDINSDGNANHQDVDIVYEILNKKIIKQKGGIGTYKTERGFINRQMIHIDCRGYKARWN